MYKLLIDTYGLKILPPAILITEFDLPDMVFILIKLDNDDEQTTYLEAIRCRT